MIKEKRRDNSPTITTKFHIEVPTHTYPGSPTCVYKVWFGRHYLIWKGKALLQSADALATSIERYLRNQKDDPHDWMYHVCNHVKRTRCMKAKIEVLESEFIKKDTDTVIDVYKLLKTEQRYLKEARKDPLCLNNNKQAHISQWMDPQAVNRFLATWDK